MGILTGSLRGCEVSMWGCDISCAEIGTRRRKYLIAKKIFFCKIIFRSSETAIFSLRCHWTKCNYPGRWMQKYERSIRSQCSKWIVSSGWKCCWLWSSPCRSRNTDLIPSRPSWNKLEISVIRTQDTVHKTASTERVNRKQQPLHRPIRFINWTSLCPGGNLGRLLH